MMGLSDGPESPMSCSGRFCSQACSPNRLGRSVKGPALSLLAVVAVCLLGRVYLLNTPSSASLGATLLSFRWDVGDVPPFQGLAALSHRPRPGAAKSFSFPHS